MAIGNLVAAVRPRFNILTDFTFVTIESPSGNQHLSLTNAAREIAGQYVTEQNE